MTQANGANATNVATNTGRSSLMICRADWFVRRATTPAVKLTLSMENRSAPKRVAAKSRIGVLEPARVKLVRTI